MARLRIQRFDPDTDAEPRFQEYEIDPRPGETVLEALFDILETQDGSLGFRYACRGAVCGSCAMHINGRYRLACSAQVGHLDDPIEIRPLGNFPIVRDLVVDMDDFMRKYEKLQPYLISAKTPPEKEILQSPKEREKLDEITDCIICTCCHASCPVTGTDPEYLGPTLLLQLDRWASDTRDEALAERVKAGDSDEGVWRCHTVFNCVEVCPKDLNPTHSIAKMKQRAIRQKLLGRARK
jgi:succinate dehydrogenase / fumarate reductase iron-sulfur subunit